MIDALDQIDQSRLTALVNHATRTNFKSFIRKTFTTLNPGTVFADNWHLDAIAWQLELVRCGDIKRLIMTMPPRSLKSISLVAFAAFIHGHDPTISIICVSYNSDLAAKLHNDYRAVLRSAWYQVAFPRTCIDPMKDTQTETMLTARGGHFATSVGGTLTGRGADLIIIDDPLKADDAMSESKRSEVNSWFGSTLLSRLNDKKTGAIVIVTQRLHSDDLVGHLLSNAPDDWAVLNLPAIAPGDCEVQVGPGKLHQVRAGALLHPERESHEVLDGMKSAMGSDAFNAQYLQEPAPPGGNMFKRAWIRSYDPATIPAIHEGLTTLQSWDTASKTGPQNDWSVCTTWYVAGEYYHLVDVFRDKLDFPRLYQKAVDLARRFNATKILVEDTGIGTALQTQLQAFGFRSEAVKVTQGKEARAAEQTAKFEAGRVLHPRRAHWLPAYEAELLSFPGGRNDDQVDSTVQALAYRDRRWGRGSHGAVRGLC